jgi:hypothetical protein
MMVDGDFPNFPPLVNRQSPLGQHVDMGNGAEVFFEPARHPFRRLEFVMNETCASSRDVFV